jgi:membrane dipeptidase
MQPAGLEGPRALGLRPLGHRLSLLGVLLLVPSLWVTCTLTTPSPSSAPTTPEASNATTAPGIPNDTATSGVTSDPRLREQALALMRDFPLVDGCVCAGVRHWGLSYTIEKHPSPYTFPLPYTGTPFSL